MGIRNWFKSRSPQPKVVVSAPESVAVRVHPLQRSMSSAERDEVDQVLAGLLPQLDEPLALKNVMAIDLGKQRALLCAAGLAGELYPESSFKVVRITEIRRDENVA